MNIDYNLLNESVKYFQNKGFKQIEVPWIVNSNTTKITTDISSVIINYNNEITNVNNNLIGSAEQGFLQLIIENKLPFGKYQSISPCFRTEHDGYDNNHFPYFIKNELLIYTDNKYIFTELSYLISDVVNLYNRYLQNVKRKETFGYNSKLQIDLMYNDIELGSYGIREINNEKYIYGTGLALPRFSQALKIFKDNL